ncbi:uncharacterized protein LOC127257453 [Andrographis paniculata]|uniref:uncharacterized protein LOC127257453 n=1 Tax=Andrographis paniculata TaxID=175694 RepID=UPI0021E7EE0C|nr:uncharacterized protein LOC127257453 [Andrographis paniculata]
MATMRKLCPNLDKEDGLETVLEVPLPEEMFADADMSGGGGGAAHRWQNLARATDRWAAVTSSACSSQQQFMLLLKLVCSPFIPCRAQLDHALTMPVKNGSIQASTAKYIVQQYMAATGGVAALNGVKSMYGVGEVKLEVTSPEAGSKKDEMKCCREGGGFVVWQKNPDLWYLELVVAASKISAGSDGNISWSQSSLNSNASKGPPRPLRRFFQGLDPRSTANLFLNTVCIGEKMIGNEACFILKLETSPDILKAHSTANTDIVHHTIWGYFSQRTGLLIQFEDSKLIRMKTPVVGGDDFVYYETSMESVLEDYRYVDGINIAHRGRTNGTLFRYGNNFKRKWTLEETWRIEEVGFNVVGLSDDYFMPPVDCRKKSGLDSRNDDNGI